MVTKGIQIEWTKKTNIKFSQRKYCRNKNNNIFEEELIHYFRWCDQENVTQITFHKLIVLIYNWVKS